MSNEFHSQDCEQLDNNYKLILRFILRDIIFDYMKNLNLTLFHFTPI